MSDGFPRLVKGNLNHSVASGRDVWNSRVQGSPSSICVIEQEGEKTLMETEEKGGGKIPAATCCPMQTKILGNRDKLLNIQTAL